MTARGRSLRPTLVVTWWWRWARVLLLVSVDQTHVARQNQRPQPRRENTVRKRATHQMPIRRPSEVARLHHNAAEVLPRIDGFTERPTALQVTIQPVAERLKLAPVVDDGDDDVAPFVSQRVEGVAAYDEPLRAVVFVRNLAHNRSMTHAVWVCIRIREPTAARPPSTNQRSSHLVNGHSGKVPRRRLSRLRHGCAGSDGARA